MKKTNAIRIVEKEQVQHEVVAYDTADGQIDGLAVAEKSGQDAQQVFKTLLAVSEKPRQLFVFVLQVTKELDLKKAAKAVGVKKIDMLPLKDLTKETGYVRGGCSPIGMKKNFPTVLDDTAEQFEFILVSAGKIGLQLKMAPHDVAKLTSGTFHNIRKE